MTTNNAHRPGSYPPVPADFNGPVLIELSWGEQRGRGRFYRPKCAGYTDDPMRAGVYPADVARGHLRGVDSAEDGGRYLVSAELILSDERARLDAFAAAIEAVKNGKETL